MIGAVIPVYNRRDNLELLLTSLEHQSYADFHVVVADDGSTDGTRDLVKERSRTTVWGGRLRWVSCGPNQGVRTGRARNIGAANLDPGTRLLVMLDSDLVLQPQTMARFAAAHSRHPDNVMLGLGRVPQIFGLVTSPPVPELDSRVAQRRPSSSAVEFGRLRAT